MSDPVRPTTYRDIAVKAGVSSASVSLALRGNPRISAPVTLRIQQVAQEMGYRPNPLLSAYQASVRAQKPVKFQSILGWINDTPDENFWKRPYMKPMLEGARIRATALGYQIDEIWIPNVSIEYPEDNFKRWEKILMARGIHGVVLPYLDRVQHYMLNWKNFSVISLGKHNSLAEESRIHLPVTFEHNRVAPDYAYNMRLAAMQLRRAGCRRIGLAISPNLDSLTDHAYSTQFTGLWIKWPVKERVPIIYSDWVAPVKDWAVKYQPDAVICSHSEILTALKLAKLSIPKQTRLIHMNLAPDVAEWSGIDCRVNLLGSAAVDMVIADLQRNERGVPAYSKEVCIEGMWREGKT